MSHTNDSGKVKAGAFDIRTFIAALIGIYGVVLVIMGIVSYDASDKRRSDDLNVNLWAGLAMVIFAAAFQAWAMLRPVIVNEDDEDDEAPAGH